MPDDRGVEALDRPRLEQVERLALRHALDDVEEHDVAEALEQRQVRQRAADHAGTDHRDLASSSCGCDSFR